MLHDYMNVFAYNVRTRLFYHHHSSNGWRNLFAATATLDCKPMHEADRHNFLWQSLSSTLTIIVAGAINLRVASRLELYKEKNKMREHLAHSTHTHTYNLLKVQEWGVRYTRSVSNCNIRDIFHTIKILRETSVIASAHIKFNNTHAGVLSDCYLSPDLDT